MPAASRHRYVGEYPVIGIRPIVGGRRGPQMMRESLEPLVWAMAEAAACADKFKREGVSITLSVTPCWCYGSAAMDMDPHTIKDIRDKYVLSRLYWDLGILDEMV